MVGPWQATAAQVADAAEKISDAALAVERLWAAEITAPKPALRAVELRHLRDELGDLRRQVLELFST